MEVIYPEETLALLAQYDELLKHIEEEYQRLYPDDWQHFMREDAYYQACVNVKAKIYMISPCTYRIYADKIPQMTNRSENHSQK